MTTIYRFHDIVAVNLPTVTRYMTAAGARDLAAKLTAVADDIDAAAFTASTLGQLTMASPIVGHNDQPMREWLTRTTTRGENGRAVEPSGRTSLAVVLAEEIARTRDMLATAEDGEERSPDDSEWSDIAEASREKLAMLERIAAAAGVTVDQVATELAPSDRTLSA